MARRSRSGPASKQQVIADFLYSWDWIFEEHNPEPKEAVQMRTDFVSLLYTLGPRVAHVRKEIAAMDVLEKLATENIEVRFDDETGDEVDVIRTLVRRVDRAALKRIRKLIQQVSKLAVNAQPATPDHAEAPDQHARASTSADTSTRRTKTGRKPMDHAKIEEVRRKFEKWREHMPEICEELDNLGVWLSPASTKKVRYTGPVTWEDLYYKFPEEVVTMLERSRRESRKLRRR